MTGRIDHRSVCGNQFYVKSGKVSEGTRQHAHKCPQCQTVVWSACASGRIRVRHNAPSGRQCPRSSWNSDDKKPAYCRTVQTVGVTTETAQQHNVAFEARLLPPECSNSLWQRRREGLGGRRLLAECSESRWQGRREGFGGRLLPNVAFWRH